MKDILLVTPPFIPVSKDSVAGIEQISYTLSKTLHEQGYNLSVIAREDSEVYGELIVGGYKNIFYDDDSEQDYFFAAMYHTSSVLRNFIKKNNVDVVIDRCSGVSLRVSEEESGPRVISCLDMGSKYYMDSAFFNAIKQQLSNRDDQFVAVSKHIAHEYMNQLGINEEKMNIIYNGIITENFPFCSQPEDYLLFLGRISKGKAPHLAIKAAKESRHKIIVAGGNIPGDSNSQYEDRQYFEENIKSLLDENVQWHGPANLEQKVELMKNAKAVLFTSQYNEALALVPLEAMACGTPVIAFNKPGPNETIIDGKTGYLVDDYSEMLLSIDNIGEIKRVNCRNHVVNNFDYKKMGEKYSDLIEHTLQTEEIILLH